MRPALLDLFCKAGLRSIQFVAELSYPPKEATMRLRERYHLLRFFGWPRPSAAYGALRCRWLTYETLVAAMWAAKERLR